MAIGKFTIISKNGNRDEIDEIKFISTIEILLARKPILAKYWIKMYKRLEPTQQYFVENEDEQ